MKLHEYQAKQLFASAGIPVPRGIVAKTAEEAIQAYDTLAQQLGGGGASSSCTVKAQIHAGGRGKAGGVRTAHSAQEAGTLAQQLLGQRLVTAQTSPEGLPVSVVLIAEEIAVREELYLSLTIDRFHARPVILASRRGGVDIESVASTEPEAIVREPVDVVAGPHTAQLSRIATALECTGALTQTCVGIVRAMWTVLASSDASLIEINPLVITDGGRLCALDAKVTLDDNALFRHPELAVLRDASQEHPLESKAAQRGISYVGLDGTIGCLVNGAGLAMATNDIITLAGGTPANFLDVGGGANVDQVTTAFAMILSDTRVKAILVNIFGGIMRCDWIAQGLLNAAQRSTVRVPLVVRLQGTNVEEGRRLLSGAASLSIVSVEELSEAAKQVVALANRTA